MERFWILKRGPLNQKICSTQAKLLKLGHYMLWQSHFAKDMILYISHECLNVFDLPSIPITCVLLCEYRICIYVCSQSHTYMMYIGRSV